MLSKMDLRVAMDTKSGQLKNESMSELFSVLRDARESTNGTKINELELRFFVQFRVHLIVQLELHLEVHFKIYLKMHK